MALSINTNLTALTVQRNLGATQGGLATSLQRLSSGLRINSAKDDAAGLAISERFTSQIRGLNQAARNANDAISLLQTAEGAIAGVSANLQRIRELGVQAANGTNSAADRQALQAEVNQLAAEIDRTGASAEFNGMKIFDQSQASAVGDADQLAVLDGLTGVGSWLENAETLVRDLYGLNADGVNLDIRITGFTDGAGGVAAYVQVTGFDGDGRGLNLTLQVDMADFVPPNLPDGGSAPYYNDRIIAHEMVHAVMARTTDWQALTSGSLWFVEGTAEFIQGADERVFNDTGGNTLAGRNAVVAAIGGPTNTSAFYSASYAAARYLHEQVISAGGEGIKDVFAELNQGASLSAAINTATNGAMASEAAFLADFAANGAAFINTFDFSNTDTGAIGGLDVDGGPVKTATSVIPNAGSRSGENVLDGFSENFEDIATASGGSKFLTFQVGANAGQTLDTRVGGMNLGALGLRTTLDVGKLPAQVLTSVDRALEYVSTQRAVIGAQISRLEYAIGNLQVSSENLTASRSRIQDTDFALETAALVRQQILQRAGLAIAAQANQDPRRALLLLSL